MESNESQINNIVKRYIKLTKQVLPMMASDKKLQWPVKYDHCFQRIVLDNICNGSWYDHLERPAYKHLSRNQALKAVQLCEDIIAGRADLNALNRQSLLWRDKKVR
mgnify:CR=1 FL=1